MDYMTYNEKMHRKVWDYFQEKYHKTVSLQGEVPTGFYSVMNDTGQEMGSIKAVMRMEGADQISEILEMFYDQRIDARNKDLDKKKVPKKLRYIKSDQEIPEVRT